MNASCFPHVLWFSKPLFPQPCPPREPLGVSNRRAIAASARAKSSSPLVAGAESSGADARPKRRIKRVSKPKGVTPAAGVQKKTKTTLGRTRENVRVGALPVVCVEARKSAPRDRGGNPTPRRAHHDDDDAFGTKVVSSHWLHK